MLRKLFLTCSTIIAISPFIHAQDISADDLLNEMPDKIYAKNAFKSTRVINGHSMEMLGVGVLDMRILHRFGNIQGGLYELFGLDQASMRLGFDYGISKNLMIGIGRCTYLKETDGFVKYRILHQYKGNKKSIPISLIYTGGVTMKSIKLTPDVLNTFTNKLGYYHQFIIGRKFNDHFSLQLAPTFVHSNLIELTKDKNNTFALGIGSRYKISRRTAIVLDVHPVLSGKQTNTFLPLSIGVDIETGGHVFQLHVSNTRGMNERSFITETYQDWSKGNIQFGFNLSRVFTVKKNTSNSL
jgi:hypothetical protein